MNVTIHPEAEQDLHEAAEFYEQKGSSLVAGRFIGEFKRLVSLLREYPQIGSPRSGGRRGLSMKVFPYTVIYRATAQEIIVLVVKHDRRRPGYGSQRK
ncbi:MAG: type II toxin-antitoxin system RelE/ParE family toxin [Burkholderiaceae bacterium]|jgi:plasmid stabilization system protein ParE|nr:type II toxin-antitoxin system RelE/ParE family toxin [Burkholderiaceae bacterium]